MVQITRVLLVLRNPDRARRYWIHKKGLNRTVFSKFFLDDGIEFDISFRILHRSDRDTF